MNVPIDTIIELSSKTIGYIPSYSSVYNSIENQLRLLEKVKESQLSNILQSKMNYRNRRLLGEEEFSITTNQQAVFKVISSNMIAGQYPIEYVYPNYAYAYYAPLPNEINYTISPPVSQQQMIGQINRNLYIAFDRIGEDTKIGVISINRNAINFKSVSDSVLLLIDDSNRFYHKQKFLNFTIKIPFYSTNEVNITYPLESVQFPCKKGIFENFDYECSNGYINRLDCDGTPGMYSIICVNNLLQKCKGYEEGSVLSNNTSSRLLSCESISYKTDMSECSCSYNTQHHLSNNINNNMITFQMVSTISNHSGSIVNYKPTFYNSYAIASQVFIYFSSLWIICIMFCMIGRYYYYEYTIKDKKPKDMQKVSFNTTVMKIQEDSNYFKNIWNSRFEINSYLHKYLLKNISKGIYSGGEFITIISIFKFCIIYLKHKLKQKMFF